MIRKVNVDPELVRNIKSGIDLGSGNFLKPLYVHPDLTMHTHSPGVSTPPEGSTLYGYLWWHEKANGDWCNGTISLARHTLVSEESVTITPSVVCNEPECKAHGYITEGRWISVG